MTFASSPGRAVVVALSGAGFTLAVLWLELPLGVVLVAAGAAFILLLPRHPREVAGFAFGVAATVLPLAVAWSSGWGCASEVDGVLVEHDCGESPPGR